MSEIPDRQYFKIGEVSRIVGVKPHVLRYWETEFAALRPQKTRSNQRLYRRRDVEMLLIVKKLLYEEGYTIAGANKRVRELMRESGNSSGDLTQKLLDVRRQIEEILELAGGRREG